MEVLKPIFLIDGIVNMFSLDILKGTNNSDINCINNFPCYISQKNREGKFISANDYFAQEVGFQCGDDLSGYSDYDLFNDEAKLIRKNDDIVFATEKGMIFFESAMLLNGTFVKAISQKIPLQGKYKKIIGTTAISIIIYKGKSSCLDARSITEINLSFFSSIPNNELTQRQLDCLYYLVKGMAMKQIAKELSLSPRTVEHYIDAIKQKLNCESRVELISLALKLPAIKNRFLE